MIRGLYTTAAGMVTGLRQQELVAENLANLNTPGFKREHASATAFSGVLARSVGQQPDAPIPLAMQRTIGRVGTGSYVSVRRTFLEEGSERETGKPLDVMLRGDGFFVVQGDNGIRYTRDGHFMRDALNRLITADGSTVLGDDGEQIIVPTDDVRISRSGEIFVLVPREVEEGGQPAIEIVEELVGRLQVVNLAPEQLVRAGNSGFTAGIGAPAPVALGEETLVVQGALEEANVDAGLVASQLVTLSRHFSASQHAFTTINQTLGNAVQDVGRVDR